MEFFQQENAETGASSSIHQGGRPVSAGEKPHPQGYAALASLMGRKPELGIFCRFRALNAQNLLYLQAELVYLENKLRDRAAADSQGEDEYTPECNHDWYFLANPSNLSLEDSQWKIVLRAWMNVTANEDHIDTALQNHKFLSNLEDPSALDLSYLQDWLRDSSKGGFPLHGPDRVTWEKPVSDKEKVDLVSTYKRPGDDALTRFLTDKIMPKVFGLYWRVAKMRNKELKDIITDDRLTVSIIDIVITTVSSMLPVLSIVALYNVHTIAARLGLVALFTAVFSFTLGSIARGQRIDVFAATAAFAAIQVVFIGSAFSQLTTA